MALASAPDSNNAETIFLQNFFFLAVNDYRKIERQQNSIVENKNKRAKTKAKTVCQSQQHRVNPQNCQLYFN